MFGPIVANKYGWAQPQLKNWVWAVILDRVLQAISLSCIRPPWRHSTKYLALDCFLANRYVLVSQSLKERKQFKSLLDLQLIPHYFSETQLAQLY